MATYHGVARFEGKLYNIEVTAHDSEWISKVVQDMKSVGIFVDKLEFKDNSSPSVSASYKGGVHKYCVDIIPNQNIGTPTALFDQKTFHVFSIKGKLQKIDAELIAALMPIAPQATSPVPQSTKPAQLPQTNLPSTPAKNSPPVSGDPLDPRRAIANTPSQGGFVPPGSFGGKSVLPPPQRAANSPIDPFGGPQISVPFHLLNPPFATRSTNRARQVLRI